jgi:hypothetical protein
LDGERRKLVAAYYADAINLETAGRFATNCGAAYHHADPPTRKLFNNAVIDRIELRDGQIIHVDYRAPFDLLSRGLGFESPAAPLVSVRVRGLAGDPHPWSSSIGGRAAALAAHHA